MSRLSRRDLLTEREIADRNEREQKQYETDCQFIDAQTRKRWDAAWRETARLLKALRGQP